MIVCNAVLTHGSQSQPKFGLFLQMLGCTWPLEVAGFDGANGLCSFVFIQLGRKVWVEGCVSGQCVKPRMIRVSSE